MYQLKKEGKLKGPTIRVSTARLELGTSFISTTTEKCGPHASIRPKHGVYISFLSTWRTLLQETHRHHAPIGCGKD